MKTYSELLESVGVSRLNEAVSSSPVYQVEYRIKKYPSTIFGPWKKSSMTMKTDKMPDSEKYKFGQQILRDMGLGNSDIEIRIVPKT